MKRILVCGGRKYADLHALFKVLDQLLHQGAEGAACVITGGAPGADSLAERWAKHRGIPLMVMPALWEKLGPSAGPIRNGWMIEFGKPDVVIAFPGGAGTKNMVARAKLAGIEVREV